MTGANRRDAIVQYIQDSASPVSGQKLATEFGVSRQVIVQDIALIRAAGYDIISPVVVCNTDDYTDVQGLLSEQVEPGEQIIKIVK